MCNEQIDPSLKVGAILANHKQGILEINSGYKTGRVEQDFKKMFGLNAQTFRKQDGRWIQTSESDSLTLKEQQVEAALTKEPAKSTCKPDDESL